MVDGCGIGSDVLTRQIPRGGGNLAGGGTNPKRGRRIPRYRYRGCGLEGGGGDSKLPLHRLHHLPGLPPWVPGGLRYGDRQTRGQTDPEGYGHEEGESFT